MSPAVGFQASIRVDRNSLRFGRKLKQSLTQGREGKPAFEGIGDGRLG
jgi:hypothetical protein